MSTHPASQALRSSATPQPKGTTPVADQPARPAEPATPRAGSSRRGASAKPAATRTRRRLEINGKTYDRLSRLSDLALGIAPERLVEMLVADTTAADVLQLCEKIAARRREELEKTSQKPAD